VALVAALKHFEKLAESQKGLPSAFGVAGATNSGPPPTR